MASWTTTWKPGPKSYSDKIKEFVGDVQSKRQVNKEDLENEIYQLQSQLEGAKTFAPYRVPLLQAQLDELLSRYSAILKPIEIKISRQTIGGGGSSKRRQEREARRAEIKSKQAEKADAKKLSEIEKQGQDLLKRRNELAQRPGYGEEVERLNEQLAELAFERDYLAGRSPTLKTAEERRREAAESESQIATRESLVQQRKSTAEREKEADRVRREVSTWIAQNPNNPAVASIKDFMSQSKMSGVDPLAIVLQAKALADSEKAKTEERARLQTEKLTFMTNKTEEDRNFRLQMEELEARERRGAKSEAQRQVLVNELREAEARIAEREAQIAEAKSGTMTPEYAEKVKGAEVGLAGLKAGRDSLKKFYEANYGTANTDFGSGGSEMGRASFIAAFIEQYGRTPTESELSKARGKYWF